MAFLARMASPRMLTAAVVGGAALAGLYYYNGRLEAGASPGELAPCCKTGSLHTLCNLYQ